MKTMNELETHYLSWMNSWYIKKYRSYDSLNLLWDKNPSLVRSIFMLLFRLKIEPVYKAKH